VAIWETRTQTSKRPSPFYVLDDSNLQRLLGVFTGLQESSQLIVITHQRRTMKAADSLYGVSMRSDGVSQGDQPAHPRSRTHQTQDL
jgi:chromosome segregation ATPase